MKKFLIGLFILISLVFIYLISQGLLQSVKVEQRMMPGFRIAGIRHIGPYEKIGDAFNQIHAVADEQGVPVKMIGVYFDNPNEVVEDSLRSLAGIIVSEEDSAKLSVLPNLTFLTIPAGNAAVSNFETAGMVSMIIGAMKSYPTLTEYVAEKGLAEQVNFVYEVYGEGKTEYVMQMANP
jgi:effector-binding domain-containing protein